MAPAAGDPRRQILALFETYLARYPDEAETVARIRAFVEAHADCFSRQLLEGHITGSAWVLDRNMEKTLLTHHKKLGIWVQPGGHADGEADVAAVALKEAEEETGLAHLQLVSRQIFDIDVHTIPARGDEPAHYHYDCRFAIRAGDEDYVVSEESHDLAWVELDHIADYTTELSILRMCTKTQKGDGGNIF